MKLKITFLFIFSTFVVFAQPPAGYYSSAQGLTGTQLKTALYNIISSSHVPQTYSQIWGYFQNADVKQNGNVWEIYSACDFSFSQQDSGSGGNVECEFFNREHVFPRAWFGGNIEPMRSDVNHIFPTDKKVNGERGTVPFAVVASANYTSSNGTKRGTSGTSGVTGIVFEPVDEYKGDIARALFYMATRYEDQIATWQNLNTDGAKVLNGTAGVVFKQWAIDLLYQWHIQDPVSVKEQNRNNQTYFYQNNRNPYIDNPQWVQTVWGNFLSTSTFNETLYVSVYPNPTYSNKVIIESENQIDELNLFNLNGQLILKVRKPNQMNNQYQLDNLTSGLYLLKINSNNESVTKKLIVN